MTAALQLAQQANPTAQTFVVDEASVLTGIGIFFASFLVPVIGGIISIPMSLIGAWMYYDHSK